MNNKKNILGEIILSIASVVFFLIVGIIEFSAGSRENKLCQETATAKVTNVIKHTNRGLTNKTVYYEFVVGDTIYKCTDEFTPFITYPKSDTVVVHYNINKPSESYIGDTPCGLKNGIKYLIISLIFVIFPFYFYKIYKED